MKTSQKSKLGHICTIRTGKLDSNAAVEGGKYPFFTCAQETFSIDKFAFDTEAVLLGGNNANGIFPLKYYQGKFNAYQRTYIIESKDRNKVLNKFVYFSLRPILEYFKSASIGAATQYLTKPVLDNLKITLPDIDTQRSIIDIVYTYDDLIYTNRRRIQLLEESARLLFREWFVYFRFPGHEKVKIVDGVPEGWEKLQVKDIIRTVNSRKKIQKSEYDEAGLYPCVDQSQEYISGYTDRKDYVINNTIPIVIFGDHTRIIKYVDFPFVSGADGTQLLVSKHNKINSEFLYFILKNINLSNYFYARHFKFLKDQRVLVPSENFCLSFSQFSKNMMKQISILRSQNQKLAQARDLLLPRLMSGTIEV
jgi:type I restriction enzyme S subunit